MIGMSSAVSVRVTCSIGPTPDAWSEGWSFD